MCNYVTFEPRWNLLPVLKIVTCPVHVRCIDISHFALLLSTHVPGCSIFSMVRSFCPDYGLLLKLHTLTLAARFYALLSAPFLFCWTCLCYLCSSCVCPHSQTKFWITKQEDLKSNFFSSSMPPNPDSALYSFLPKLKILDRTLG